MYKQAKIVEFAVSLIKSHRPAQPSGLLASVAGRPASCFSLRAQEVLGVDGSSLVLS